MGNKKKYKGNWQDSILKKISNHQIFAYFKRPHGIQKRLQQIVYNSSNEERLLCSGELPTVREQV